MTATHRVERSSSGTPTISSRPRYASTTATQLPHVLIQTPRMISTTPRTALLQQHPPA